MSWEQNIIQQLENLENAAVRFDIQQDLSTAQKTTAKANVGISASATQIEGNDYKLTFV